MTTNWLDNLKAGDRVYIHRGGTIGSSFIPAIVERATKTVITVNGTKFRRSDGGKQNLERYFPPSLSEATEALDAKYRAYELKTELTKVLENINKLTIDQVERMLAIAKEGKH